MEGINSVLKKKNPVNPFKIMTISTLHNTVVLLSKSMFTISSNSAIKESANSFQCDEKSANQITSSYGAPNPAWWRKLAATQVYSLDFL